jgi:Ferritin-like domain
MDARATRRQLIRRSIAVGGAAAVLAPPLEADAAVAAPQTDAQVLAGTLVVEDLVVLVYRQVLASGALTAGARRTVAELLGQERQHAAALAAALARLGAALPAGPRDVAAADKALGAHKVSASLANLRTERDCLELLIDVESVAEGAYFVAISRLQGSTSLRLCAEIMASEAQHWSALSELRLPGDLASAVPDPFVEGYP